MKDSKSPNSALASAYGIQRRSKKKMLEGAPTSHMAEIEVTHEDMAGIDDARDSLVDKILHKRRMAKGGEVDVQDNGKEDLNLEDQLSFKAGHEDDAEYDDDQLSAQPEDSNEDGLEIESDKQDMISAIRKKMRSKQM